MNIVSMKIKDLALQIKTGSTPSTKDLLNFEDGAFNWYTPSDFLNTKSLLENSSRKISQYAVENYATVFQPKTVLITCIGDIGRTGIIEEPSSSNQQITGVLVNEKIINPYFFNYLIRYNRSLLKNKSSQAILPILNNSNLREIELTFSSSLETQNKIVAILDKANSLIEKREVTIGKYDELLRAVFLDMFLKFQGINEQHLDDVAYVVSGLTKGKKNNGKTTSLYPYMRVANVQDGYLDLNEIKEIEATDEEAIRYKLEEDDLLLTEGGDPDKLGRGTLWKKQIDNCIYQNHIFRVRTKDREVVNPTFLSYQLSSQYGKAYFLKAAKQTSGIASINSSQLKAFPVYVPPGEEQVRFEVIANKCKANQKTLIENAQSLKQLLNALSQLVFKGELRFNTAVELEVLLENDYQFFTENSTMQTIQLLLNRLDKYELNDKKIYEQEIYNKAKGFVFGLLEEGKIKQVFDAETATVKLSLA